MNLIFIYILPIIVGCALGEGAVSHENELRTKLLDGYNPEALPAPNTNVSIGFSILHFDMNEEIQSLDLDMWVKLIWEDPRLKWSIATYPDIPTLSFQRQSVWHPDITLYSRVASESKDMHTNHLILARPDGNTIWVPHVNLKAACVMDMLYWPYDIHNCTAKFGSWVHSAQQIDLNIQGNGLDFEATLKDSTTGGRNLTRGEWSVVSTTVTRKETTYTCCPQPYVNIMINFVVERNSPAYAWLAQVPVVVLSLLTLVVFVLPPSSGERIVIGGLLIILDYAFLFGVTKIIGHSANHTPLIVKLVSKQLILTAISIFLSAIILRLIRDPISSRMPAGVKKALEVLATVTRLSVSKQMVTPSLSPPGPAAKSSREELELNEGSGHTLLFNPEGKPSGGEGDWVLLAAVGDRLCLISFVIAILAHLACYSSVL